MEMEAEKEEMMKMKRRKSKLRDEMNQNLVEIQNKIQL